MFSDLVDSLLVTDDDALVGRLRAHELEIRRLRAEQAAITREVERRRLFDADGHRSVAAFLRAHLNWSTQQATATIKIATLLDTVPGTGDALLGGTIGTAQARELARLRSNPRVGDRLTDAIGTLLDAAEQMKYDDFRIVGQRWETLADADGAAEREAANVEHRDVTVLDACGELFMRGSGGSPVAVAEMVAVFDSFVEHEFRVDCAARDAEFGPNAPTSLLPRTDRQRRFDAMQRVFRSAQAAAGAGMVVGPIPTVVTIIVSQFDLEHGLARAGLIPVPTDLAAPPLATRRREIASGAPIGDDELVRAAIHGRVRSVVMDHTGMPVSYGRSRRLFTGPIREMAKLLGHRCSHPGCNVPASRCEVDHLEEFNEAGETSLVNAGIDCASHNRHKHRSRLRRRRIGPDEVVTTRADGTEMRPVGQRQKYGRLAVHPEVDEAVRRACAVGVANLDAGEPEVDLMVVHATVSEGQLRLVR